MKILKRKLQHANNPTNTMNTKRILNTMKALTFGAMLLGGLLSSHAQDIPAAINYQGRLTDNLGNPLASGYYEIQFRIWDDATATEAASLVWGRSFPLHVITNGLFNILLSNNGGRLTNSTVVPQFDDLRQAFGSEDRYLGLTISMDPSGTVNPKAEISPRQQLASAAYAIQAQTANKVAQNGVNSDSISPMSVTGAKIAVETVVTTNLANGSVSTSKIADGAVTASKLNIQGNVTLNDHLLLLKAANDQNNVLRHTTSFGGVAMDGPALYGNSSGVLGTSSGGQKAALTWRADQSVSIGGDATIGGNATIEGDATIKGSMGLFGSMVDLSRFVTNTATAYQTPKFTAHTDGFMMYYGCSGAGYFQLWPNGRANGLFNANHFGPGAFYYFYVAQGNGRSVMWPIRKGDVFQWTLSEVNRNSTGGQIGSDPVNNDLFFMPIGASQGDDSITMSTDSIIPYNQNP
jgi:hypothetical protein